MSELGRYLKETREEQGMSMDELQERTKIQRRYLIAIEEGDYDSLPGAFYARAFVKSYAEALRLNSEEIFEEYASELPKPKQKPVELPSRAERSKPRVEKKKPKLASIISAVTMLALVLVLSVAIWMFSMGDDESTEGLPPDEEPAFESENGGNDEEEDEEDEAAEEDAENAEAEEDEEDEEGDISFETVSAEGEQTVVEVSGADELEFELFFDGEAWTEFRNEAGATISSTENGGESEETHSFTDQSEVTVRTGYSPNLTIVLNGEEYEYDIDPGQQDLQNITFVLE
ncbi:helix-turn-helix domain-containing protein [Salsuginibacillus kocurii]|uniref:helix-turn-helix domain-containing protein n=1 Tax=Salsuginibacillus kocurii TaxID=427078 RepID=UPI00036513F5|nr:RodZ domain-containing protein [Salsuginibacillus kocurii]